MIRLCGQAGVRTRIQSDSVLLSWLFPLCHNEFPNRFQPVTLSCWTTTGDDLVIALPPTSLVHNTGSACDLQISGREKYFLCLCKEFRSSLHWSSLHWKQLRLLNKIQTSILNESQSWKEIKGHLQSPHTKWEQDSRKANVFRSQWLPWGLCPFLVTWNFSLAASWESWTGSKIEGLAKVGSFRAFRVLSRDSQGLYHQ